VNEYSFVLRTSTSRGRERTCGGGGGGRVAVAAVARVLAETGARGGKV